MESVSLKKHERDSNHKKFIDLINMNTQGLRQSYENIINNFYHSRLVHLVDKVEVVNIYPDDIDAGLSKFQHLRS